MMHNFLFKKEWRMKCLKVLSLLAITMVTITVAMEMNFEHYVKGVPDHNGNNIWHILADACNKHYFPQYIKKLKNIDATEEDEKTLAFLASERNNQDQSPLDIAVANWVINENKNCAEMMRMIHAWKIKGSREYKGKKINECPFADLLAIIEEQEKAALEKAESEDLNSES
jgi:hypothetical protein